MKHIFSAILSNKLDHSLQWHRMFTASSNELEISPRDIKIEMIKNILQKR